MPITFGSVGDIISVCIIVKDIVTALDEARGSPTEYQDLRRELFVLDRALLEVELLSRSGSPSAKLNALYATTRKAALDCRRPMEAFLDKIKKYEPSLGDSGARSIVRDTAMKLRWQMSKKDEISKFRAQITAHSSSINMLLATANVSLAQDSHKELSNKLSDAERRNQTTTEEQSNLLVRVEDRLKETNALLSVTNTVTAKIKDALKLDWLNHWTNELKGLMQRIIAINLSTYQTVIAIQANLTNTMGRSLIQEPFILEDAIGRISPVHLQFIDSWDAFDAVLEIRFREVQGYKKIVAKEYALQEHATRREISRARPWAGAFLSGQKIEMSLIFKSEDKETTDPIMTCPSCHTAQEGAQDSEILCNTCGIYYRRITEFFDVEPLSFKFTATHRPHQAPSQFGRPSFNDISYGPKRPSQFPALPSSTKRKSDQLELEEDDICQFKRIRLISTQERIKHAPGPFLYHTATVSSLDPSNRQEAEEKTAWEEYHTRKTTLGDLHPDTLEQLRLLWTNTSESLQVLHC